MRIAAASLLLCFVATTTAFLWVAVDVLLAIWHDGAQLMAACIAIALVALVVVIAMALHPILRQFPPR